MTDAPAVPAAQRARTQRARGLGGRGWPRASSAALAALLAACASKPPPPPPPPDTDATRETARAIVYDAPHADSLDCEASGGPDCADWFDFQPNAPGILHLTVSPGPGAEGAAAPPPGSGEAQAAGTPFDLLVTDADGVVLGHAVGGAEPAKASLNIREPKVFYVAVTLPPGSGRHDYVLGFEAQVRIRTPAPAAEAPAKTRRWSVLRMEKPPGAATASVLIDGGRRDALRPGLRGRLVDGERTLARIVVTEVFEEGSRARVEGTLTGEVTPETKAEIEIPADGR